MSAWSASSTAGAGALVAEDIRAAADAIRKQPRPAPCAHVVSPRALTRPGRYRCTVCGQPVEIPYPLIERC